MALLDLVVAEWLREGVSEVTHPHFDEQAWIARLAVALEQVAAGAEPSYSPLPPGMPRGGPIDEYWTALHRGYRALAARAKHDPTAAAQFRDSHVLVRAEPVEAMAILRDHPLMEPGLEGSGKNEGVRFSIVGRMFLLGLTGVVLSLVRLSIKEGGEEAARRLHRYLTAGANATVPANEFTVLHGLVVNGRFNLGMGAYLAPYRDAMAEFGLPDQPEPLSETSLPNAAVLVRSLEYGPGLAPPEDDTDMPDVQVAYRFPSDYRVNLWGWFDDSQLLVDLLAIATRLPLLSRTAYVRLAKWIEEIGLNFAHGTQSSRGFVSDVWPRRGRDLSQGDVDAFLKLARGWHAYLDRPDAMNLAIRRLAASFSRPGGRFGQEDRVLDVAIALEVLYGGTTGHKLAQRAAALLGGSATEQKHRYDQAKGFYDQRSRIVHSKNAAYSRDVLGEELEAGRDLACLTLMSLLDRGEPPKWADVMRGLLPETQAHIKATRDQRDQ